MWETWENKNNTEKNNRVGHGIYAVFIDLKLGQR